MIRSRGPTPTDESLQHLQPQPSPRLSWCCSCHNRCRLLVEADHRVVKVPPRCPSRAACRRRRCKSRRVLNVRRVVPARDASPPPTSVGSAPPPRCCSLCVCVHTCVDRSDCLTEGMGFAAACTAAGSDARAATRSSLQHTSESTVKSIDRMHCIGISPRDRATGIGTLTVRLGGDRTAIDCVCEASGRRGLGCHDAQKESNAFIHRSSVSSCVPTTAPALRAEEEERRPSPGKAPPLHEEQAVVLVQCLLAWL